MVSLSAAAPAILAPVPPSAMLTKAAAPALPTLVFLSAMLTNAAAPALPTPCHLFAMLTFAVCHFPLRAALQAACIPSIGAAL